MLGTRTATGKHGLFWLLGQLFKKRKDIVPNRSAKGKKEHRTRSGHPWQRQQDLACSSPSTMPATKHKAGAHGTLQTAPILVPTRALLWEHTGTAPALQALELLGRPQRRRNAAVFRGISESKRAQTSLLLSNTKSSPLK